MLLQLYPRGQSGQVGMGRRGWRRGANVATLRGESHSGVSMPWIPEASSRSRTCTRSQQVPASDGVGSRSAFALDERL